MNRKFYASQSPRGFANEITVHFFDSRQARDEWVDAHASDGDVNSAYCSARSITAKRAWEILNYSGDAVTKSYNSAVQH